MDGYFVTPVMPVVMSAPHVPGNKPRGNSYFPSLSVMQNFWSVRDLWLEEVWQAQSEVAVASPVAQVQPAYIPYESTMIPVVMISW